MQCTNVNASPKNRVTGDDQHSWYQQRSDPLTIDGHSLDAWRVCVPLAIRFPKNRRLDIWIWLQFPYLFKMKIGLWFRAWVSHQLAPKFQTGFVPDMDETKPACPYALSLASHSSTCRHLSIRLLTRPCMYTCFRVLWKASTNTLILIPEPWMFTVVNRFKHIHCMYVYFIQCVTVWSMTVA